MPRTVEFLMAISETIFFLYCLKGIIGDTFKRSASPCGAIAGIKNKCENARKNEISNFEK